MHRLHRRWTVRRPTACAAPPALVVLVLSALCLAPAARAIAVPAGTAPDAGHWRTLAAERLGAPSSRVTVQALPAAPRPDAPVRLAVELAGTMRHIVLEPRTVRGPGFRVLAQVRGGALVPVPVPPAATWRGAIEGVAGSRACAALVAGAWQVVAVAPQGDALGGTWTITPLRELDARAPAGLSAVARAEDLPAPGGTCAVAAPTRIVDTDPAAVERAEAMWPTSMRVVQVACDADSEFYGLNGNSVPNTVADIEAVIAGASMIYEGDLQTTLQVGTILVRTAEPDPYSSANPSTLLAQMQAEWTAHQADIVRDVAQLFTGKSLGGTTIGNSYVGGMCYPSQGYCLVQSRFSSVLANRIEDSAHELAHTVGIGHCDYSDFNCRIMCSSIGACSGGIHSFGPWEVSVLRNDLASLACLDTATVGTAHASLPFSESFTAGTLDAAMWTAADRYTLEYGRMELDHSKGFGTAVYLGTVRTLPMLMTGLPTLSYRIEPSYVPAGQQLVAEYFDTQRTKWVTLDAITSPGGAPGGYTTYTHALGDSAMGTMFALRFTACGNTGFSGAQWYLDDVSITAAAGAPEPLPPAELRCAASPNPFALRTRLAFELPAAGPVRLEVFDGRGARVRTLLDGARGAGPGEAVWDGRDASGRAVASGVYLARLECRGGVRVVRLVRLR